MNVFGQPGNHGHIAVKLVVMDLRFDFSIELTHSLDSDLSPGVRLKQ